MDTFLCKWYFWAEGHCPPLSASAVCLQTKGKECQFCFASLEVSFFFLLLSPSPRIYRHFCFLAPTPYFFISSARAPLRWLLSCENGVIWLQWIVRTVSPSNLISFGRDCSSPHQEVQVALHLHIYFCSTVDICKRGTSRLRMVKSKKAQKKPERIQSSAAQSRRRAHTWDDVKAEQKVLLGKESFSRSLMEFITMEMDDLINH